MADAGSELNKTLKLKICGKLIAKRNLADFHLLP